MATLRTGVVQRPFMGEWSDSSGTALLSASQIEASGGGSARSIIDGDFVNRLILMKKGNLT